MDAALIERIREQMRYEFARTGPPDGFPTFPIIPKDRYTSDEFWELEQEHVFGKSWVIAGRVEDIPNAGDYFVFTDLQEPLPNVATRALIVDCFAVLLVRELHLPTPKRELGGHYQYDVPQRVIAKAVGAGGERVTLELDARRLVYRQDVVEDLGAVSRFLVSAVASPMAYTYENKYKLRIERDGQPAEERSGGAFSEFSYVNKPANLPAF